MKRLHVLLLPQPSGVRLIRGLFLRACGPPVDEYNLALWHRIATRSPVSLFRALFKHPSTVAHP